MDLGYKSDSEALEDIFSKLDKLREEGKYCDIVFVGDDGCEFYAHKNVLSLFTEFFSVSDKFKTENEKMTRVNLKDLDIGESVIKKILEIIYMKNPTIARDEVMDILFAADKLLMDRVIEYVGNFIGKYSYLNAVDQFLIKLCEFPSLEKSSSLLSNVEMAVNIRFPEVTQLSEFYELPVRVLCLLNVFKYAKPFRYPEIGVDFIVKWLMCDIDNRIADIKVIVEYLNCGCTPNESNSGLNHVIDSDAVDTFLSIITEVRGINELNSGTLIDVLRLCLRGLLSESIREQWDNKHNNVNLSKQEIEAEYSHLSDWLVSLH